MKICVVSSELLIFFCEYLQHPILNAWEAVRVLVSGPKACGVRIVATNGALE